MIKSGAGFIGSHLGDARVRAGYRVRVLDSLLAQVHGPGAQRPATSPEITGKYRVGDLRHCFADISLAKKLLGYSPSVTLDHGLRELAGWLRGQVAIERVDEAKAQPSSVVLPSEPGWSPMRKAKQTQKSAGFSNSRHSSARERPVLITDGSGFVGANLAQRLLQEGRSVVLEATGWRPRVSVSKGLVALYGWLAPYGFEQTRSLGRAAGKVEQLGAAS